MFPEFKVKFAASITSSQFTVYAEIFNSDYVCEPTFQQAITITSPTLDEVETETASAKSEYELNANTQTLSENIAAIGRIFAYAGQSGDGESEDWAVDKMAQLPFTEMNMKESEQGISAMSQSGSLTAVDQKTTK